MIFLGLGTGLLIGGIRFYFLYQEEKKLEIKIKNNKNNLKYWINLCANNND